MIKIADWTFGSPLLLLASLSLIPIGILLFKYENSRKGLWKITHLSNNEFKKHARRIRTLRISIYVFGAIALFMLFMAIARPYSLAYEQQRGLQYNDGLDIVLAIDISESMLEQDFSPNRIEVAKKVAIDFVKGRKFDRIGLVVYAGEALTLCPPTTDYKLLISKIENITTKLSIQDGTAIGVGLGTAVTRLRNEQRGSKVIILLTDGSNNYGELSPVEAAKIAHSKKIRVYTIGMGKTVQIHQSVIRENSDKVLDESTLRQIANITNGQYFHVNNEKVLNQVYTQINNLEKRKIEQDNNQRNAKSTPEPFIWTAIICISIFWFLNNTIFHTNE